MGALCERVFFARYAAAHEAIEEVAVTALRLNDDARFFHGRFGDRFTDERVEDQLGLYEFRFAQRVGINLRKVKKIVESREMLWVGAADALVFHVFSSIVRQGKEREVSGSVRPILTSHRFGEEAMKGSFYCCPLSLNGVYPRSH